MHKKFNPFQPILDYWNRKHKHNIYYSIEFNNKLTNNFTLHIPEIDNVRLEV